MSKNIFGAIDDVGSATESDPVDVNTLTDLYFVIFGTFVGTVDLEFSIDGTNFHVHPTITGKTAAFNGSVGFPVRAIRTSVTAWTSGTVESVFSGVDARLGG